MLIHKLLTLLCLCRSVLKVSVYADVFALPAKKVMKRRCNDVCSYACLSGSSVGGDTPPTSKRQKRQMYIKSVSPFKLIP